MLSSLWRRVVLDYPTDEELALIVAGSFPKLTLLVSRLIGTVLYVALSSISDAVCSICAFEGPHVV